MSTPNSQNHTQPLGNSSSPPPPSSTSLTRANLQRLHATQNMQIYLNNPHNYERVKLGLPAGQMRKTGKSIVDAWEETWRIACGGNGA
ncbi:hypothetical protein VTL71DRAFT_9665 [Oculimacula yallundae]|uniref:Uncharacterized protein n=1 Tax=Oculimacula yallundae TaxID=86028 RepID=A0ABR4BRN3_9HELO